MSRLFILLALCALASACATGRAFTKSPYSFPSRAKLVQEAQKPAPAQLYGEPVAEVASWTVEHARSTLGPAPFSGEHPFAAQLAEALAAHGEPVIVSEALTCTAQETARFRASTGHAPSLAIARFIAARCGSHYASLVSAWSLESTREPDDVQSHFAEQMGASFAKALASKPTAVGVGFAQVGTQYVATIATGREGVKLNEQALTPDGQGHVTVEGELPFDAEALEGLINQGPRGYATCERSETIALPRFRFVCPMAEGDSSAWIELLGQRRGRVLSQRVLEVLAIREGAEVNTFSMQQAASRLVSSAEEFESYALAEVNAVRKQAGLHPLAPEAKQALATRALAPHFFHAVHVSGDDAQADTIALGLLAGYDVERTIRHGGFVASLVPATRDVNAWVREVLDGPYGRKTLLDPQAEALALGGVVHGEPAMLGALAYTYTFFERHDHAADANALAERIRAARVAAGVPAAPRVMSVEAFAWKRAREVLLQGKNPERALGDALADAAYASERPMRGYVVATVSPESVQLPKEILGPRVTSFAVASSHYQPEGSKWAVQVLFILFSEQPGGEL